MSVLTPLWSKIAKSVFTWFRTVLPRMSETERAAIEAGTVGWESVLFQGKPDWQAFGKMILPALTAEEQHFIQHSVSSFCEQLDDWDIVHRRYDLSPSAWEWIKKEKFFGITIPKEFGGWGFSALAHSEIITTIATKSISAAVTVMVPNSLGPAELLLHYGTQAQKQYYLPRLATADEIPCFALTSVDAGSDAGAMTDQGVVCQGVWEGETVLGISLSFEKRYITLAPIATLIGVAFKLYDPEGLIGDKKEVGITLALIPASHPGVVRGKRHFPLNLAFMNGPIEAKEIFIPLDWIIGGRACAGQGWRMLMECLAAGRGISLPALSTAMGATASKTTTAYAQLREQFKTPIAAFEGVEEALARIIGYTYMLQAMRLFTVFSIEHDGRPAVATAIAKYHMTELARKIINDAMDIHGGRGIMLGPKNYLGRAYQAMPICITVEGANILTRNLMIFGQGAIRCHPFVKAEMEAARHYAHDPEGATQAFEQCLTLHAKYFICNMMRSFILSLTRGRVARVHATGRQGYYRRKIAWMSASLALVSDSALMILGGTLKRKERLSARLGDILSQLYIASAVLKWYESGEKSSEEKTAMEWAAQHCLYSAQEALYAFFDNAPSFVLRRILKIWIFPFGRAFSPPSDLLSHRLVKAVMYSTSLRNKLTSICYQGNLENDPVAQLEHAYHQKTTDPQVRRGVLEVDAFEPSDLIGVYKK